MVTERFVGRVAIVIRDLGSVGLGLWGIARMIQTGEISEILLIACMALLGVPGAAGAWGLRSGNGQRITESRSDSQSP